MDPVVTSVNHCEILDLAVAGDTLDPQKPDSCDEFRGHVRGVQAVIVFNYKMTAHRALRESDPAKAADLWRQMAELCDSALSKLLKLKDKYPYCGTPELYDLTLDYKEAAFSHYRENLEDAECLKNPVPDGLFPKTS